MGGSGGGAHYGQPAREPAVLAAQARAQLQRQEQQAEIGEYLDDLLAQFNSRDAELTNERLDTILECLGDEVGDLDRLLFGGSVAKHTYVDGLSDVDALAVLRDVEGSPAELLGLLARAIREGQLAGVVDVSAGDLAVTVTYADGGQLQLLPAQENNGRLQIASEDGRSWREISPRKFAEKLTEVNQRSGGGVVPAVKLAKAALQQLPEGQRLSGYHLEAIAVDAFKNYDGAQNRQAMLLHLLNHAASAVLRPTGDITGQSVKVDDHFGPANSDARKSLSAQIGRIVAQLDVGESVTAYRVLFDD